MENLTGGVYHRHSMLVLQSAHFGVFGRFLDRVDVLKLAAVTAALLFASPSLAQVSLDSMTLATALGDVLASEEACGMSFDQGAITAFIEDKVAADDLDFTSMLNMMTVGRKVQIGEMSQSEKTAHCSQVRRVAKSYKFTE